jgi:hypothetical protein
MPAQPVSARVGGIDEVYSTLAPACADSRPELPT